MTLRTTLIATVVSGLGLATAQSTVHADTWLDESSDDLLFVELPSVHDESKYRQKVSEAPGWISVITAEEIRRFGFRSLVDILDSVPGFYTSYDREYHALGVRGFGDPDDFSTRLLLMLDGVRINDGGLLDTAPISRHFPIDIDLIERIEISRGPGISLYGGNAMTAVVNVITKRGRDFQGLEASVAGGSNRTAEVELTYGTRNASGGELLVSASQYDSAGNRTLYFPEYDSEETNFGVAENVDGETDTNISFKIGKHGLSLHGAVSERHKVIPTGSYGSVFNAPENTTTDQTLYLNLRHEHVSDNYTEWRSDIFAQSQNYSGDALYDITLPDDAPEFILNTDATENDWFGVQSRVTLHQFEKHKVMLGADARYNSKLQRQNYDSEEVFLDDTRSSSNWGLYIQDQYTPTDNLQLFAGLRYDNFKDSISETTPRLGLVYNPLTNSTVKLLYSTSFRAPNSYELYSPDLEPLSIRKNDLQGERIDTYEIVLEQQFNEHWLGVANFFYYELGSLISLTFDEENFLPVVYNETGEISTRGVDFSIDGKLSHAIKANASVTVQQTDNLDGGKLPNSPTVIAKLGVLAPLIPKRLMAGLDIRHSGERGTLLGETLDSFTLTNLTLTAPDLLPQLDISASVYNLFNTSYQYLGNGVSLQERLEQNGREFRLKLAYRF